MTKKFGHVENYKSAIDCVLCYTYIAGGEDYTIHITHTYVLLPIGFLFGKQHVYWSKIHVSLSIICKNFV